MTSKTQKVKCGKCKSEDRNLTETWSKMAQYALYTYEEYCNNCGDYISSLSANGRVVMAGKEKV